MCAVSITSFCIAPCGRAGVGALAVFVLAAMAPGSADAGAPAAPRPHIEIEHDHALITELKLDGAVALVTASGRIRPEDSDVRFVPLPGSLPAGTVHARVDGGRFRLTSSSAGTYDARVESPTHPELPATELHVRFLAPADRVPVTFVLHRHAGDRATGSGAVQVTQGGFAIETPLAVASSAAGLRSQAALSPGAYVLAWHGQGPRERRARVRVPAGGGIVDVAFEGSQLALSGDWLPSDRRMFELVLDYGEGETAVFPLHDMHAAVPQPLSDDALPGRARVVLRETPRVDPWVRPESTSAWTERYRGEVDVPRAGAEVIAWSMPRLFAGAAPARGPWQDLPSLSRATLEAPGVPSALHVSHGAVAWFEGTRLRTLAGGFASFTAGRDLPDFAPGPMVATGPMHFAWVSGQDVFYRTPRGVAAESLPTYTLAPGTSTLAAPRRGPAYPCDATGIASPSAQELVVVGACRGNAPVGDATPSEGFIAERDATHWQRLAVRPPPLRALASEGAVLVAVGDGGAVSWRRAGTWTHGRRGTLDLVDVGLADGRAFAQTRGGDIVDLASPETPLPWFEETLGGRSVKRRARSMCVTTRGPVAWFVAERWVDGAGPPLADRLALWDHGAWRPLLGGDAGLTVDAMACDGSALWVASRRDGGRSTLARLDVSVPAAAPTVVW